MRTEKITIRLPKSYLEIIDTFVKLGEFSSRTEAIRRAVRALIKELGNTIEEQEKIWENLRKVQFLAEEVEKYEKK